MNWGLYSIQSPITPPHYPGYTASDDYPHRYGFVLCLGRGARASRTDRATGGGWRPPITRRASSGSHSKNKLKKAARLRFFFVSRRVRDRLSVGPGTIVGA